MSKQVDKEVIGVLKQDTQAFLSFLHYHNDSTIIDVLKKLGRLQNNKTQKPLLQLLHSPTPEIRALSVKNLAKMSDISLLSTLRYYASHDPSTQVRREAVSAIGRLRNETTIPTLIAFLTDKDPKLVMQAIRGLLVFTSQHDVQHALQKLLHHPNEVIKEVVHQHLKNATSHKLLPKHDECLSVLCNTVVEGDVQAVLKYVPDQSIHLTFTSPPYYNARDYSLYQSYTEYLSFLEYVFREVYRVTKEGRFFVLNTSPIILPRMSRAYASRRYPIPYDIHPLLVKMGWEFIDDIVWVKPEASVKNRNASFLQHRKPLGYKPNVVSEMLMVYRKKTEKLIDWNIRQYPKDTVERSKILGPYETTNIWRIDPTFHKFHSAVFPLELCKRVIRFYSFVGDLVFDPFAGSGTLGQAALHLERKFFLTEKESKYMTSMKEVLYKVKDLFSPQSQPRFLDTNTFISFLKNSYVRDKNKTL